VSQSSVARRYAKALLSLGAEDGRFEAYAEELQKVAQAFAASAELRDVAANPAYGREQRHGVVAELSRTLALSPVVANLLRLLVDRQRLVDVPDLARAYGAMVDEKVGRVRAVITAAVPLPAEVTERLGTALAAITKKRILLEAKVDKALIGGVVAQVGSTVLDGSLRTQLEGIRDALRNARA
jgi:F-type H+-transporting ATPase subunit delta